MRVDADEIVRALPVDGTDIESEIDVRFVTHHAEALESEWRWRA